MRQRGLVIGLAGNLAVERGDQRVFVQPCDKSDRVRHFFGEPNRTGSSIVYLRLDALRLEFHRPIQFHETTGAVFDTLAQIHLIRGRYEVASDFLARSRMFVEQSIYEPFIEAFVAATEKLVVGDPTFEAAAGHAKASHAEVVKVKLNATYAHDLPKMQDIPGVGLHYVCNPNNPTASITPPVTIGA